MAHSPDGQRGRDAAAVTGKLARRLGSGGVIGILGGGQLGRMLALAAAPLGFKCIIYDPARGSPAFDVAAGHICAAWDDWGALERFAASCDVITLEFENVPVATVQQLAALKPVMPGARSLEVAQDRLVEKRFVEGLGLPVAPHVPVGALQELAPALDRLGGTGILKTRRLGYDGKGQVRLDRTSDLAAAWAAVGGAACVLEGYVPFVAETSAIIARARDGSVASWDCPANEHAGGILRRSSLPGPLEGEQASRAQAGAARIAEALDHIGVLSVEYFVLHGGSLVVNEIAPRVHNSGHWTIEGAVTSQFANHVRAVAGWPLAATGCREGRIEMCNLIGAEIEQVEKLASDPAVWVHDYGKAEARQGRKMGHFTRVPDA
jgi:5-(carboxyamino)imidazole ribonucleotide synthase